MNNEQNKLAKQALKQRAFEGLELELAQVINRIDALRDSFDKANGKIDFNGDDNLEIVLGMQRELAWFVANLGCNFSSAIKKSVVFDDRYFHEP
jgi:hypothetical protein